MKFQVKFDIEKICKTLLSEKLEKLGVDYNLDTFGQVEVNEPVAQNKKEEILTVLNSDGIEVVNNQQMIVVEQVKAIISKLVKEEPNIIKLKVSEYIENKLPYTYSYLSRLFKETTHMSIEKYVILKRIDYVKELLLEDNLNQTEIAHKLNYSSVAHLSKQFKNTTGFTPTAFVNLKNKIKNN